ncbi:GDAP1 [Branchiostoma lanceolatum]|uniref:Ganglioside-induced differentiation-associated protein 1 n=1 Tax=Branchiostoma lanceolatum TaxID=7740 RepID=A0A8K0A5A8_BRALA|nr:GDAP1 [Branchiostoma lanceolatum]
MATAEGESDDGPRETKLVLYHFVTSFYSQKARLALIEKRLKYDEHDVSLPLNENTEPWFMRINPSGEVPVLVHGEQILADANSIINYIEETFTDDSVPRLVPPEDTTAGRRVRYFREILDNLPVAAYTHGCILHPQLTADSMIPSYATAKLKGMIAQTEQTLTKRASEHPDLSEAYMKKQKQLQQQLQQHDDINYMKRLLHDLEETLDFVERELVLRFKDTHESGQQMWLCCETFTAADIALSTLLHRLTFLGLSRRYWGNGIRPHIQNYYTRVQEHPSFKQVLGNVNNILWSAVMPTIFRMVKRRSPHIMTGASVLALSASLMYMYFKRKWVFARGSWLGQRLVMNIWSSSNV